MRTVNTTSPAPVQHEVTFTFTEAEAVAIRHARRALRKATLRNDLSANDANIVNAVIMTAGRVLDDREATKWEAQ